MGVDNCGILFLGRKEEEVDFSAVADFDIDEWENDIDYLSRWSAQHGYGDWSDGLIAQADNGMDARFWLIGFRLATSGSYGCVEIMFNELAEKIKRRAGRFEEIFGISAKLYIMNYLS